MFDTNEKICYTAKNDMKKTSRKTGLVREKGIRMATDVLVLTVSGGELRVLLIQIDGGPYAGKWAIPGGLVGEKESLDAAADRVLSEKAGVKGIYLEQLYTFGSVDRDCRGRSISTAYFSLVSSDRFSPKTTEYYKDIRWVSVHHLPKMAFDHKEIVAYGVARLQNKIEYSNIAYGLLPKEFTLSELQTVYEIILGRELDKRNFRKKILALHLVRESGNVRRGEASRPARLYAFASRTPKMVEVL